jgi:hypothetical protein
MMTTTHRCQIFHFHSFEEGEFLIGKGEEISRQQAYKMFVERRDSQSQKMNVHERATRIWVTGKAKNIVLKIVYYNHNVI